MKKAVVLALAAIMVLGVAGAAFADVVTYDGSLYAPGRWQAAGTVNVSATVNPKLELTIDTPSAASQTVAFGAVDPGTSGPLTVNLAVSSNKQFDLTASEALAGFQTVDGDITLNRTLADQLDQGKGAAVPFSDDYSIDVPWTVDPGTYSATVTYTALQD